MDFSSDDEALVDSPVNPDLPDFFVIPPRLWVGKTVLLHNGSDLLIAEGLVWKYIPVRLLAHPVQ